MALYGHIKEFDSMQESWGLYTERLQQYFEANEIADDNRKRAIFLTVIGPTTYGLLHNLLSPDAPAEKTLEQLVEILDQHFDPAPSEIVERFKFNSRVRQPGESFATYFAELRRLAKFCNYGTTLEVMLRDRIVCGISDEAVQKKLLAETNLTLQKALDISLASEAAASNAVLLKAKSTPVGTDVCSLFSKRTVNKAHGDASKRNDVSSSSKSDSVKRKENNFCFRCGSSEHQSSVCKFINSKCFQCGKIGHIGRICQSKDRKQITGKNNFREKQNTKRINQIDSTDLEYCVLSTTAVNSSPPPISAKVKIEGFDLMFEVDTGAPYTLIPSITYEKCKHKLPPLENSNIKLRSYTKSNIDVLGVIHANVFLNGQTGKLPLLVTKQGTINLLGRNWFYDLNVISVLNGVSGKSENSNSLNSVPVAPSEVYSLNSILGKHKGLFSSGLGLLKDVKVHLTLKESVTPSFYKARPVPYSLKKNVDTEIDRLLEQGVLEPVKTSDWATPVVSVLKPNGTVRLCGDFKLTVNKATELEKYPLPNIEDLFAQLSDGIQFSKLDLKDAYCQLKLDDDSSKLTVVNTHRGLFRYSRLAFGIASAPAIFQREIDKILRGQPGASCYLDDLLVTGSNKQEHLKNLDMVLSKLENAGIKLHPDKCEFMKDSVEYLGYRIDKDGLHPVQEKLDAIQNAPAPANIDELRSFIGLVTYYAKFLPNMSNLLAPLYNLLKREVKFRWSKIEDTAFRRIKGILKSSSLLVHFDPNKEIILACDASPYGLGAVISHKTKEGEKPIAFASRSLSRAEKNYSQLEKEALALIFGVTRFRKYLLGNYFTLLTDHRPLTSLLSESKPIPAVAAARVQRWAVILSAYAYKIQYRKGSLHVNADAMSRLPIQIQASDPPVPPEVVLLIEELDDSPITAFHLQECIRSNPDLSQIKKYILQGWPKTVPEKFRPFWLCRHELSVEKGLILRGSRVYIPGKYRDFVLDELHDGHRGMTTIKGLARSKVWWPNIDRDIEQKVRSCNSCQINASSPPAVESSWPTTKEPWERIHIDHAGPFEGKLILIIVDSATKWIEAIEVSSTSSANTIAVLRNLFSRFGLPRSIVSDNSTSFTSSEFEKFMQNYGINHILTPPYHPNSNGLAERAVRTIKEGMKKVSQGSFKERLINVLFAHRRAPVPSSGISPAEAFLGRTLRTRLDLLRPEYLKHAKSSSPPTNRNFRQGDNVWTRSYNKSSPWIPAKVISPIGNIMYKLRTPSGTPLFRHLDQVRSAVPDPDPIDRAPLTPDPDVSMSPPRDSLPSSPVPRTSPAPVRRSSRVRRPPERLTYS